MPGHVRFSRRPFGCWQSAAGHVRRCDPGWWWTRREDPGGVGWGGFKVIGIDCDPAAVAPARRRIRRPRRREFVAVQGRFSTIETVLHGLGIETVDGILADLGLSTDQLDDLARGSPSPPRGARHAPRPLASRDRRSADPAAHRGRARAPVPGLRRAAARQDRRARRAPRRRVGAAAHDAGPAERAGAALSGPSRPPAASRRRSRRSASP